MSRKYSEGFKRDFVGQVLRSDRTLRGVAADLGVPVSTGQEWTAKYRDLMSVDDGESTVERLLEENHRLLHENRELKKQNEDLEEDREILKKATRFCVS